MDANRFDSLARSLTVARSRRGAVGSLLAGTLGLLGLAEAVAKKKGKGKKGKGKKKKDRCKKGEKRCDKKCCEAGQECIEGVCYSPCVPACGTVGGEQEICCFGFCANLSTDSQNCGQCGTVCAENEVCRFANCVCDGPRCPTGAGTTRCCPAVNGVCCEGGKCCPAGETCQEGNICCPNGYYSCGNSLCCPIGLICAGVECLEP